MSIFQIVILVVAVILVLSSLDLKKIFGYVKSLVPKKSPEPDTAIIVPGKLDSIVLETGEASARFVDLDSKRVTTVVNEWEQVREICVNFNLVASVAKLDEVFPTFLDLVQAEVNKKEEVNEEVNDSVTEVKIGV